MENSIDSLHKTYQYLLENTNTPVRRGLMDEIDWSDRLIAVRGSRGVGKTCFLLDFAKENYGPNNKECLYINLNNFLFTFKTIRDFVNEFRMKGGRVLLIDQIFKYPEWWNELGYCYENYPDLQIIFSASSVIDFDDEKFGLTNKVKVYNLRGFSFREYLSLLTGKEFRSYTLKELLDNHADITANICAEIKPLAFLDDYLHHGFYPFFLEKRNFQENLLKTMNMMLEIDVLSINQIEQSYLPKLRKLLYQLSLSAPGNPNVSQLSQDIETSRATIMNYIKYLKDARLINMLYPVNEEFPKKPALIFLQNPNLIHVTKPHVHSQSLRETFFYNQVHKDNKVNLGIRNTQFLIDEQYLFNVGDSIRGKFNPDAYYAIDGIESGEMKVIPLWLFGFLY